eukprot:tig00000227_g19847.t1
MFAAPGFARAASALRFVAAPPAATIIGPAAAGVRVRVAPFGNQNNNRREPPRPSGSPQRPRERQTSWSGSTLFGIAAIASSVAIFGSSLYTAFADAAARGLSAVAGPAREAHISYDVLRSAGDGRCLFRSIVQGRAFARGDRLTLDAETKEADQLRKQICDAFPSYREQFELFGALQPGTMDAYLKRLANPAFWGGELEMLIAADLLKLPIFVYLSDRTGYYAIQKYGEQYTKSDAIRLLYNGSTHYDLLLPRAGSPPASREE